MMISIIIRTLNEAEFLGDLLAMIARQRLPEGTRAEVVLVDSGSTDGTLGIARRAGARITTIDKAEFSFGRSLNRGCAAAKGAILVFISGHCVPVDEDWLARLTAPVADGRVGYAYGRQVGDDDSNYSERRIFAKYFPDTSRIPQQGFFVNNANAALARALWEAHPFDEDLTGLEDMALGKALQAEGHALGYVAEAPVFHHHRESWAQVRRRFEREAIALQRIMPEVTLSRADVLRYVVSSVWMDWQSAWRNQSLAAGWWRILRYRLAQYSGSHAGNNDHRRLSRARKDSFFYPSVPESETTDAWLRPNRRPAADEGEQPAGKG